LIKNAIKLRNNQPYTKFSKGFKRYAELLDFLEDNFSLKAVFSNNDIQQIMADLYELEIEINENVDEGALIMLKLKYGDLIVPDNEI
jgi:hypothetical protein